MNRNEFMSCLRSELADVTTEEREEAIKFYNEYFDDAGVENEQTVIQELGTPKHVAANIRANCGSVPSIINKQDSEKRNDKKGANYNTNNTNRTILLVILAVLTFPIWIGFAGGAIGVFVGILVTIFTLLLSGFLMFGAGIFAFFASIPVMAVSVPSGIVTMGISLMVIALGCLFIGTMLFVIIKGIPAFGRGVGKLFGRLFSKRRD